MATTCTFLSYGPNTGAPTSEVSGTISLNDESFLNISNPLAPVVVTVTADKVRTKFVAPAAALAAGIPSGTYERVSGATFRLAK